VMYSSHPLFGILGGIFSVFLGLLVFAAVIAVLFLLIRFLIVGTHAAQLYVAKNAPAKPPVAPSAPAPAAPAEPAASSVVPPTAPVAPTTAPATPATTAPADDSIVFEEVFASSTDVEPTPVSEPIVGELELETGVAKVTPTRATRAGTAKTADASAAPRPAAAKKPATRTPRATAAKPAADGATPPAAPRPRTRKTPPPTA